MIANSKITPSFSVQNIENAKKFYVETLGLKLLGDEPSVIILEAKSGSSFMIYEKDNHLAATYTVLNFEVEDIEEEVKLLKDKGIIFEQYPQMPTNEDGIAKTMGSGKAAWFKDPAGNILSVMKMDK